VLSQTEGYAAHALLENLERTRILSERLEDTSAQFDSLSAACLLNANTGTSPARRISPGACRLAERLDASAVLQSCFMRGAVALWRGDLGAAGPLLARALASPVALERRDRPYGGQPGGGGTLLRRAAPMARGDSAGARAVQQEALALAERNGRPFTVAQAVMFRAFLLLLEGSWEEAGKLATRGAEVSEEYGFPLWQGTALVVRGWGLVEGGERARGLAQIEEGLALRRSKGLRLGNSLLLSLHAGACLRAARIEEGLAAAHAGLTHCRETTERCFEAELWRLKGELVVRRGTRSRPDTAGHDLGGEGVLRERPSPGARTGGAHARATRRPRRRRRREARTSVSVRLQPVAGDNPARIDEHRRVGIP
jgi:hypothetical protein